MAMEGKTVAENNETWVCHACGKTWGPDRYDAPEASCFIHAALCKLDSVTWVSEPVERNRGRCKSAEIVDYDWTDPDWRALREMQEASVKKAREDGGAEAPQEAGAPETTL
jgi:hypothetical protein